MSRPKVAALFEDDASEEEARQATLKRKFSAFLGKSDSGASKPKKPAVAEEPDDDEDADPLDAFMMGVEETVKKEKETAGKEPKPKRADFDQDDDDDEALYAFLEEKKREKEKLEGEPERDPHTGEIVPLIPIDHSKIKYPPINKNFYEEHPDITKLPKGDVDALRTRLGVTVRGARPPKPCISFPYFGLSEEIMKVIRKAGYHTPTPIQAQTLPAALSGRDTIGIAMTGSGKTAAYVVPMIVHIMDQQELQEGDGPIALILAPTRELVQQINLEVRKFGKPYRLVSCPIYGGGNKYEQSKDLKQGCEIIVATPGRLIDLIKSNTTNLQRVSFVVLDEADRMFSLGFEPQVRSLLSHCRPDRQTLLFSATLKKKISKLIRDVLTDPVRVVVGKLGEANEDITQVAEVLTDVREKWQWLLRRLVGFQSAGNVLVFVTKKADAIQVADNLKVSQYTPLLIHGDMDQHSRNYVLQQFKKASSGILVATDVAARGLDIPSIRTVVNYDVARDIDTHTHRIGRTGRAGVEGKAYTLLTPRDIQFAGLLVRNMEGANQYVSSQVLALANQDPRFKEDRLRTGADTGASTALGRGRGISFRGRGRGFSSGNYRPRPKVRPGLGMGGHSAVSQSAVSYQGSSGAVTKEQLRAKFNANFQSASSAGAQASVPRPPLPPGMGFAPPRPPPGLRPPLPPPGMQQPNMSTSAYRPPPPPPRQAPPPPPPADQAQPPRNRWDVR